MSTLPMNMNINSHSTISPVFAIVMANFINKKFNGDYMIQSTLTLGIQQLMDHFLHGFDVNQISHYISIFSRFNVDNVDLSYLYILTIPIAIYLIWKYRHLISYFNQQEYVEMNSVDNSIYAKFILYIDTHPDCFHGINERCLDRTHENVSREMGRIISTEAYPIYNDGKWIQIDDKLFDIKGQVLLKRNYREITRKAKKDEESVTINLEFYSITLRLWTKDYSLLTKYHQHIEATIRGDNMIYYHTASGELMQEFLRIPNRIISEFQTNTMNTCFSRHKQYIWNICHNVHNNRTKMLSDGVVPRASFILHGPPGTGKSSMAYRIACAMGRHIYTIDILKMLDPFELDNRINNALDRVIVLDEFDKTLKKIVKEEEADSETLTVFDEHGQIKVEHKNKKEQRIRVTDLLSIFQGTVPKVGLILFATANDFDFIKETCPELVRPGRLTPLHFDYPDNKEIQEMTKYFFKRNLPFEIKLGHRIPHSQISEMIINIVYSDGTYQEYENYIRRIFGDYISEGCSAST